MGVSKSGYREPENKIPIIAILLNIISLFK